MEIPDPQNMTESSYITFRNRKVTLAHHVNLFIFLKNVLPEYTLIQGKSKSRFENPSATVTRTCCARTTHVNYPFFFNQQSTQTPALQSYISPLEAPRVARENEAVPILMPWE